MNFSLAEQVKTPIFSLMLEDRLERNMMFGAGLLHLGFSLAGVPFWTCPIRAATGIPCPGCGLTRAFFELLRGDISTSLNTHLFAPVLAMAFGLLAASVILPQAYGARLRRQIRRAEVKSGITSITLVLLLLYWILRTMGFVPFPNLF